MLRRVLPILPLVLVVLGCTVILGAIVVSTRSSVGEIGVTIAKWSLVLDSDGLKLIHRMAIGPSGFLIDKVLLTLSPFAVGLALVVPGALCGAIAEARRRQRAKRGFPMMNANQKSQ